MQDMGLDEDDFVKDNVAPTFSNGAVKKMAVGKVINYP
jgi:hypothetical protein